MKRILRNFVWQREDEPQNMLAYIFLVVNAFYGVSFTFFTDSTIARMSAFTQERVPIIVWGVAVLLVLLSTLYAIAFRNRLIGCWVGIVGAMVWAYGATLYYLSGTWFAASVIYMPQVAFWFFWYVGVKRFYIREDNVEDKEWKALYLNLKEDEL